MNIDKWLKACRYLKQEFDSLQVDEQSAVDLLADFWRNDFSSTLVEECQEQMQVLKDSHKYHGNNKEIIEYSKDMCAVVQMMTKNPADFKEFQTEMKKLAGQRPASRPSRPTPPPPPPAPSRPTPRPSAPSPSGRSSSATTPPISITRMQVCDSDLQGNLLQSSADSVTTGAQFISPIIDYKPLRGGSAEISYKLYNSNGRLVNTSASPSYSNHGVINLNVPSGTFRFAGIGSSDGSIFRNPGSCRVEFYWEDWMFYSASFMLRPQPSSRSSRPTPPPPPRPASRPTSRPVPPSAPGPKNRGCGCWIWTLLILAALGGAGYWLYNKFGFGEDQEESTKRYILANSLSLRSVEDGDIIEVLPFFAEVNLTNPEDSLSDWAEVTYRNDSGTTKLGKLARYYLIGEEDQRMLASLAGENDIWDEIPETRYRLALLDYLKKHRSSGFRLNPVSKYSVGVLYPKLNDGFDSYKDFAFVLEDTVKKEHVAVVYAIGDNGYPVFRYAENCDPNQKLKRVTYYAGNYKIRYSKYVPQKYAHPLSTGTPRKKVNEEPEDVAAPMIPAASQQTPADKGKAAEQEAAKREFMKEYTQEKQSVKFVPATYPGGEAALLRAISKNLVYPSIAAEQNIQGVVVLRFQIQTDGSVGTVDVVQSLSPECDAAAIEAVRKVGRFNPALQNGNPVPTWFKMPLNFRIS